MPRHPLPPPPVRTDAPARALIDAPRFDGLVSGFYQAAAGTIGWLDALAPFQHALSAFAIHLHGVDLAAGRIAFSHAATDMPPEAELDYVRTYYRSDPRTEYVVTLQPGEWFNCWETFDDAFVARDRFYQDFLIPYGGRHVSGTKLLQDGSLSVILGVHRGYGSPVLDADEIALCRRLGRHLSDALVLHRRLIERHHAGRLGATLLGRLRSPVVLLDEQRRLRHANPAAEALLDAAKGLFTRNSLLYCERTADDDALLFGLRALLRDRRTADDEADGKPLFLRAGSRASSTPLGLYLQALRPDDTLHAFGDEPLAMMTIHDPRARLAVDPFVVATAFGLTPAEAKVAAGIAEGATPERIAARHRTSIHTVRSQIQTILQKTGTTRQAQLVGLLAGLTPLGSAR